MGFMDSLMPRGHTAGKLLSRVDIAAKFYSMPTDTRVALMVQDGVPKWLLRVGGAYEDVPLFEGLKNQNFMTNHNVMWMVSNVVVRANRLLSRQEIYSRFYETKVEVRNEMMNNDAVPQWLLRVGGSEENVPLLEGLHTPNFSKNPRLAWMFDDRQYVSMVVKTGHHKSFFDKAVNFLGDQISTVGNAMGDAVHFVDDQAATVGDFVDNQVGDGIHLVERGANYIIPAAVQFAIEVKDGAEGLVHIVQHPGEITDSIATYAKNLANDPLGTLQDTVTKLGGDIGKSLFKMTKDAAFIVIHPDDSIDGLKRFIKHLKDDPLNTIGDAVYVWAKSGWRRAGECLDNTICEWALHIPDPRSLSSVGAVSVSEETGIPEGVLAVGVALLVVLIAYKLWRK